MKIVELIVEKLEDLLPFDSVALVKDPAIQADFYAFNDEELIDKIAFETIKQAIIEEFVTKLPGESKDSYIGRCIPVLKSEGYGDDQAAAICYETFDSHEEYEHKYLYVSVIKTDQGKKYVIDDTLLPELHLEIGKKYCIDQSDESNMDHPMRLSITPDGIHNGGHAYLGEGTDEIEYQLDKIHFCPNMNTPNILYYYCVNHPGMGGEFKMVQKDEFAAYYDPQEVGPGSLPLEEYELESYNDYPEAASNNACKVLRWIDEHGRDQVSGMTQVGLARANQLCNKENISESTIARMAAFERHRRNAVIADEYKGTPWKDKGYVAWLGWGGDQGVRWAQKKLERIKRDKDSLSNREEFIAKLSTQDQKKIRETLTLQESSNNFKFSTDEEQMKVTGPLLIPNKLILRIDEEGNPYYVFFSEDTVKEISERMLKDKRVDQVNLEHTNIMVDSVMTESWLVTDPENDKSNIYGMTMPKNTWMATYQINDPKVWDMVKAGVLRGYSLEGYFADKLTQA